MDKQNPEFNEEQLRRKIQRELEQKYQSSRERSGTSDEKSVADRAREQARHLELNTIRSIVEWEIFSGRPEFQRCENHLSEIRWLTPLELEKEYEFYAAEENWFKTYFRNLYWKRQSRLLKNPKWKATADALREQLNSDLQQRLDAYYQRLEEIREQSQNRDSQKIYKEEVDRFYSQKSGYKKFRNNSGDIRWMTDEEYHEQDEYYEEIITGIQIARKWLLRALPVAVLFGIIYYFFIYEGDARNRKAFIIITSNEERGHLYVDKNLIAGFKINAPTAIDPGEHDISFIRGGFDASPKMHHLNLVRGDTVTLEFELRPYSFTDMGVVIIDAPYNDANVFIDGDFHGGLSEQPHLILPEGAHTIYLEKVNYSVMPPQHVVNLQAGDTVRISYKMALQKAKRGQDDEMDTEGIVAVASNINSADIYLDGQKTGFRTDYVLQKIPYGQHVISLSKPGYKVYPEERVVKLSRDNRSSRTEFTLSSTTRQVIIDTEPVVGFVIIDGKDMGRGHVQVSLPLGEHIVEFEDVENYQKPDPDTITVTERGPANLKYSYAPDFSVSYMVDGVLPAVISNFIKRGYSFNDGNFRVDDQYGPDIYVHSRSSQKIWRLGYTFQYKNPPGSDGIEFYFSIPDNFDLNAPLQLKLWIYQSKDNYPLAINGKSYYAIDVNSRPFRKQLLPAYGEENLGESSFDAFPINTVLRPGSNKLFISALPTSTAHIYLWKAAIE